MRIQLPTIMLMPFQVIVFSAMHCVTTLTLITDGVSPTCQTYDNESFDSVSGHLQDDDDWTAFVKDPRYLGEVYARMRDGDLVVNDLTGGDDTPLLVPHEKKTAFVVETTHCNGFFYWSDRGLQQRSKAPHGISLTPTQTPATINHRSPTPNRLTLTLTLILTLTLTNCKMQT